MPLSSEDYSSIARMIELEVGRLVGRRRDTFFAAYVVAADMRNKLIWVKELGDQPIPLVGFHHKVVYFDESPKGTSGGGSFKVYTKTTLTEGVQAPSKGDLVLICRAMNYDGHPYCLGIIQSNKYSQDLEDI